MKQHKLFWGSSYDRGLENLLFMWPEILEKYPDAELHIAYGWDLFDVGYKNNPERMKWKEQVNKLMTQKGIKHYGRVGKEELKKIRSSCGIWAYPTAFEEINCITALEAQNDGLVPVTMALAALNETVGSGIKVEGDISKFEVQEKFLKKLLYVMSNNESWRFEVKQAQRFAKNYTWENISQDWAKEFETPAKNPRVSVVTVTIREGWWNIMASNLSEQTYKNFEWVIVDDYNEDRSEIAKKYADKYGLNIKYIRGDKALGTYDRKYGLVRANNKGWQNTSGELIVWLQDFILIPEYGIERLVTVYNHNPNALIAPTDKYFFTSDPDLENKEDWWTNKEVVTSLSWVNVRNEGLGLRSTDNPMDFEMNYSATPKHIVEKLNGWWEFFDQTIGYDNTEFADRAMRLGYKVLIDDSNVATCLDLDKYIPHNLHGDEAVKLYDFLVGGMDNGLSPIRDEKEDSNL